MVVELAAGDDQPLDALQVLREPHRPRFNANPTQGSHMFCKITLQSQNTDFHAVKVRRLYQPLPAISSSAGMAETCRPTIGSPRLRLTSARILGSL